MKGLGASSRIFELLDARPLTVKLGVGRPLPVTTPPRRIIFDNVHFAYPSRPNSEVLRGCEPHHRTGHDLQHRGR